MEDDWKTIDRISIRLTAAINEEGNKPGTTHLHVMLGAMLPLIALLEHTKAISAERDITTPPELIELDALLRSIAKRGLRSLNITADEPV